MKSLRDSMLKLCLVFLASILCATALCVDTAQAQLPKTEVSYCAVFMSGKKIGYLRDEIATTADGNIKSTTLMTMSMSRFDEKMEVKSLIESLETAEGKPISFSEKAKMGSMYITNNSLSFDSCKVTVSSISALGGKTQTQYDRPADLIQTPHALKLYLKKMLANNVKTGVFSRIEHSMNQVAANTVEILERRPVKLIDRVETLTRCKVLTEGSFGKIATTQWIDDQCNTLKSQIMLGSVKLTLISCGKDYATTPNESLGMETLTIKSPAVIDRPYKAKSLKFTITKPKIMEFPNTGEQKLINTSKTACVLTQTVNTADESAPIKYTGSDPGILKYLKPSKQVESDNEKIIALAKKITKDCKNAAEAIDKITLWVDRNIKPTMSVPYYTALETLETKQGDCSEHAAITAALFRASGMPCRILSGLAYTGQRQGMKNLFSGHAWNQVYAGGKWICVDTAYGVSPARITQIIGSDLTDLVSIVSQGSFTIDSVEVKYGSN